MEIVPTSIKKKNDTGLNLLLIRKAELKKELSDQRILITLRTQNLVSTSTFTSYLFRSFNKGLNIVDAAMIGYKIFKSIRSLFRKFK